ncbi:hypothetical protein L218DRAFT_1009627 [Marasmius fiardii PR-910]|nr:hypothetical protein L218DRAFT_1009627 [Marasmius fiardii PR-910]
MSGMFNNCKNVDTRGFNVAQVSGSQTGVTYTAQFDGTTAKLAVLLVVLPETSGYTSSDAIQEEGFQMATLKTRMTTPIWRVPRGTIVVEMDSHIGGNEQEDVYMTDENDSSESTTSGFTFDKNHLEAIHACIQDIELPSYVSRPPINLGQPSHGTLKAADYLLLFTVILPLVIPELWSNPNSDSDVNESLLDNFYHLVASTNIMAAYSTSNEEADAYTSHYSQDWEYNTILFPTAHSMPNHHYAMHNASILKYWDHYLCPVKP